MMLHKALVDLRPNFTPSPADRAEASARVVSIGLPQTRVVVLTGALLMGLLAGCIHPDTALDAPASGAGVAFTQYTVPAPGDVDRIVIEEERSLTIRDPGAMDYLTESHPFSLGELLEDLAGAAEGWAVADGQVRKFCSAGQCDQDRWVRKAFAEASEGSDAHDAHRGARLREGWGRGIHDHDNQGLTNPYQRVLNAWPELNDSDDQNVGRGPFRLLAVVNRMDAAGIKDRDGLTGAKGRRAFGEGRLVFGFADADYERAKDKAFPMTVILEYRLPAIGYDTDLDAYKVLDKPNRWYGQRHTNSNKVAEWRQTMHRWGKLWRSLSQYDPSSSEYRSLLAKIVRMFAQPDNLIAMRSNVKIRHGAGKSQFELRDWYMNIDGFQFRPRGVLGEPYFCANDGKPDGSNILARMIRAQWLGGNTKELTVDIGAWDYDADTSDSNEPDPYGAHGYGVYMLPRNKKSNDGSTTGFDLWSDAGGGTIAINDNGVTKTAYSEPWWGCSDDVFGASFRDSTGQTFYSPKLPFAVVMEDRIWNPNTDSTAPINHLKRHAFAMQTCSGCHGAETGNLGFHIGPRLPNDAATVSRYLAGDGAGNAVPVTVNGREYRYHQAELREAFLERVSSSSTFSVLTPYDNLYRPYQPFPDAGAWRH